MKVLEAEYFVSENPRITDDEIITECEFVKACKDSFYPMNRL